MERVSLTYFVDFALKVGTPKLAGVKEFKEHRYDHLTDFYKPLREAIVEMHEKGRPDKSLDDFLGTLTDERKRRIFPGLVEGYRKFLNAAPKKWFTPAHTVLPIGDLEININPELGFENRRPSHAHQDLFPRRAALAEAREHRPRPHQLGARADAAGHAVRDARREERAPLSHEGVAEPAPAAAPPRRGRVVLHDLRRGLMA
ncbi:MAG: hypothetical protein QM820_26110 [Minicystis sp.]